MFEIFYNSFYFLNVMKVFLKEFGYCIIFLKKEIIEINMYLLKINREEKRIKDNIYLFLFVLYFILI